VTLCETFSKMGKHTNYHLRILHCNHTTY